MKSLLMKIRKYNSLLINIAILIFILFVSFVYGEFITIGNIWSKIHSNSLIGLQGVTEDILSFNFLNMDIYLWENLIVPFLKIPISIWFIFIPIFLIIKYLKSIY